VSDGDLRGALSLSQGDDPPGRFWAFDEFLTDEDTSTTDLTSGFTSMGFIRAALRRSAWFWCTTAVVGMLAGFAALKHFPPSYQASTTILLSNNLPGPPGEAVQDDAAIAQSRAVAGSALRALGLPQSPESFTGDYTAAVVTNRVFVITVKATSYNAAVREAKALASAFIRFQTQQLESQERLVDNALQQQIATARQHVNSINSRIKAVSAQPPTATQRAKLSILADDRKEAKIALIQTETANLGSEAATKIQTATLVKGTQILDPAVPLPLHTKRYLALYVGGGFLAGLMLGLFIVILRALVSDRLRRRDDVARALGAPVMLSVGKVRSARWRPSRRGRAAAPGAAIPRIVAYLRRAVPPSSQNPASLVIVPVDDVQLPARCVVALAESYTQQGLRVVVADLCHDAPAARLLGAAEPGVHTATSADGARLLVMVPDPEDVFPVGPLGRPRRSEATEPLAAACASADLVLTLATLDPSIGGQHLAGWARGAVVFVTAGRSSAPRIHAVGEMIRLSGMELISAVLVGADKSDESLGVSASPGPRVSVSHSLGS